MISTQPTVPGEQAVLGKASGSRRNGARASCEQCRRQKVRCDHRLPSCSRCLRTGSHCWYHPAPLTKAKKQSEPSVKRRRTVEIDAADQSTSALSDQSIGGDDISPGDAITTSHDTRHVAMLCDILTEFRRFDLICRLVNAWYELSQTCLVQSSLVLPALDDIKDLLADSSATNRKRQATIATKLLDNTRRDVEVPVESMAAFYRQHLGENLRVETLGIAFATAGRACAYNLGYDEYNGIKQDDFTALLFKCSNTCLQIAREVNCQVHDALVWLGNENFRLSSVLTGDGEQIMTQLLASLIDDILTMRLHLDPSKDNIPWALAEMRRRTFIVVYNHDKSLAVLLDLPPRLLDAFSTCARPLDLPDDLSFAEDKEVLKQTFSSLSPDGWDPQALCRSSTWLRVRHTFAQLREKVIKYSLRKPDANLVEKLRALQKRLETEWDGLPQHVKYTPDCWTNGLRCNVTASNMTVTYLHYLQLKLRISSMLIRAGEPVYGEQLQAAMEVINVVLYAGGFRDRAAYLRYDATNMLLNYGRQAAVILAKALSDSCGLNRQYKSMPSGLSRGELIRKLSVFCSYTESVCDSKEANYEACMQAAQAISRTIDEVLDEQTRPASNGHTMENPAMPGASMGMSAVDFGTNAVEPPNDFSQWNASIDWGALDAEWTAL